MKHLKLILCIITFLFSSCKKEQCVTCIAESSDGKIIETRMACDKNDSYLKGFIDGFKDRHRENKEDEINVQCTYNK
ncbi:hypothetical protein ABTW24_24305 [Sphingobacterium thalpophilum]|uniref:Lipoprotein n=2 Tax=Sphingobacterium TaxID=28453 RepID=A0A4U9VSS6_9SPHI|nr:MULTISPECIES: hypothetical protein [Sphingobacterium]VTR48872.1 Uncharacterised protein [Sphingobacterium thalpophilum]